MSELDKKLDHNHRKKTLLLPVYIVIGLLILSVIGFVLVSKAYSLRVLPNDAMPVNYEVTSGIGLFVSDKFYTLTGSTRLAISAPKYKPAEIIIDESTTPNIEITLEPLPGTLNLTTSPASEELTWRVDGDIVFVGSPLSYEFPPGAYQLTGQSDFYQPIELELTFEVGEHKDIHIDLQSFEASLELDSVPQGATVTINGEMFGQTPVSIDTTGGVQEVEVSLTGYEILKETLSLTWGERHEHRTYQLQPLQALLNVELTPTGGTLFLNGVPITSPTSIDADKDHVLRYEKQGFLTDQQELRLSPGETRNLAISLDPELGEVVFNANVPATITVNKKAMGLTPVRTRLQSLAQSVTFSKPGYRSVTREFTPDSGKITQVNVELLTEFDARRAAGEPLFVSQLGIEMVPVSGEDFTMGSAPNTPKRQRNEHQVNVRFDRPFLISSKEITEAQFARFRASTATSNLPVTNLTWLEAAMFCNWLSEQEGLPRFYNLAAGTVNKDAAGYRLPTEAEWEYSASKYLQFTKFKYFWGVADRIPKEQGNFADASLAGKQTFVLKDYQDPHPDRAPVGSYKSRSRLFDMDGNVAEWVHDKFNVIPPNLAITYTDYLGQEDGSGNVVKGGSFKTGRLQHLRNAHRRQGTEAQEDIGFRIARYEVNP